MSRIILRIFLLISCLASPTAWAKPLILTIGDSLTFGLGVEADKTWPQLLENRLHKDKWPEAKVINAGSSGATTAFGLSALRFHLKRSKPDLIIYALGANDGLRGIDPNTSYQNIKTAMQEIQAAHIKVLLLGMKAPPNYGSKFPKDFEATFAKIAKEFNTPFVPFFLDGAAGDPKMNQADGIHPNDQGYVKVLENIYPKVKELL